MAQESLLESYLAEVKTLVLDEMKINLPLNRPHAGDLYKIMMDYPLRGGKSLRPALCISSAMAQGAPMKSALHTATILEMYHNAFLIHDDVEDASDQRRHAETLNSMYGNAIAINVGDGMLAICIKMMLENTSIVGVGKTLRIIEAVSRMAQETAEGQMLELEAIRKVEPLEGEKQYVRMVHKKTAWYSFIAPLLLGAILSGRDNEMSEDMFRLGTYLGIAFQIKDDLLNLQHTDSYGKEENGDLWEGKYTLMLIYVLQRAHESEKKKVLHILSKPRPSEQRYQADCKTEDEVLLIRELMDRYECLESANRFALRYARRAERQYHNLQEQLGTSRHTRFLGEVVQYVVSRQM